MDRDPCRNCCHRQCNSGLLTATATTLATTTTTTTTTTCRAATTSMANTMTRANATFRAATTTRANRAATTTTMTRAKWPPTTTKGLPTFRAAMTNPRKKVTSAASPTRKITSICRPKQLPLPLCGSPWLGSGSRLSRVPVKQFTQTGEKLGVCRSPRTNVGASKLRSRHPTRLVPFGPLKLIKLSLRMSGTPKTMTTTPTSPMPEKIRKTPSRTLKMTTTVISPMPKKIRKIPRWTPTRTVGRSP